MVNTSIINKFGKVAGWNNVIVRLLGRDVVGIVSLEYDDSVEKENVKGAGMFPVGQGDGNYEAKASLTLLQEEKISLTDALPPGVRLQDVAPFDIIVSYDYNSRMYTDVIRNCQFMNNGVAVNQGDKSINFKIDLLTSHIDWNV